MKNRELSLKYGNYSEFFEKIEQKLLISVYPEFFIEVGLLHPFWKILCGKAPSILRKSFIEFSSGDRDDGHRGFLIYGSHMMDYH